MGRILRAIKEPSKILQYVSNKPLFNKMSDEKYLKFKYYLCFNKKLNLDNPKTFNEKMQWLKLNDRKEIYTKMVDKYEVKKLVADKIGEEYVIKTLKMYVMNILH